MATMKLRPYQEECVARIRNALTGKRSTLLVLPTGCGKTVVFCEVIRLVLARGMRALVLAHRGELLEQAKAKLAMFGITDVGIEKAGQHADGEAVVVASVQTLRGKRLERFAPDAFGMIVVDESRHSISASYLAVLDHLSDAKVLGVTATPDRLDGKTLGRVFESVAYNYALRDAIRDGWLVRIRSTRVRVKGLNLAKVRTTGGDLNKRNLAQALSAENELHAVAAPLVDLAGDRKTVVFTVDVEHAERLTEVLNRYRPGSARWLAGTTKADDRRATLDAYRRGEFQYLANCALLTEGWDEPSVSCVAVARPTKSRALYAQMIGRGTRLHPGKDDLLVAEFTGNSGRHRLVTPADVLAGRLVDDDVAEEVAAEIEKLGEGDVLDALEQVESTIGAKRQQLRITAVASYIAQEIDPFMPRLTAFGVPDKPWARRPATDRQLAALANAGLKPPDGLTAGQASELMMRLAQRREAGLCTYKQARRLSMWGYEDAHQYTKAQASELIGRKIEAFREEAVG